MARQPNPTTVSKFLARHLRHQPQRIGIALDPAGWTAVDALLAASAQAGLPLTRAQLDAAVDPPAGKRRYEYDTTGTRIRAVQGHSVPVELGHPPADPPSRLYHGTHPGAVAAVLREGLLPRGRHHVHLSPDAETAGQVGGRRGRPVVLEVRAGDMARAGHVFLLAPNGVWLVDAVPPEYLRRRS
jgi:putative RNA 2'-phosphotransferase